MRKKLRNIVNERLSWLTAIGLFLLWEIAGHLEWLPAFIFPTPSEIFSAFVNDWQSVLMNARVTLIQAFIGLGIGISLAFVSAILMDLVPWIYRAFYPLMIVTQTIPTVAIAPILVLWLGYDMAPKIVLVVLTTFFPILISILNGFMATDRDAIQLLTLMGANRFQILRHVKLPASRIYFLSGLRISVTYAFVSSVVAEWLGGFEGLGVYLIQTKRAFSYDKMFAAIMFISIISLIFMGIVKLSERLIVPWQFNDKKTEGFLLKGKVK